jgi:hypothetical protein
MDHYNESAIHMLCNMCVSSSGSIFFRLEVGKSESVVEAMRHRDISSYLAAVECVRRSYLTSSVVLEIYSTSVLPTCDTRRSKEMERCKRVDESQGLRAIC